ncbi:DNA ligase D [Chitinophaga sp. GCM10012297]|uniref:DNA ligase (ATP) n=1 Tax=Chitinophaga chungangae TaxID=2821488 RepID=A0ABS3YF07_9BACT|nr:DNA ligase D [Chitinophaga chungangae]MBO9153040.1 DNA ligase D [Chitinophaga chungangae]
MSLQKYHQKRDFQQTSEPRSGKSKGKAHIFVVQRHHATRLHYDFRLEMDGVLKSWAVPKGPSLNPEDKRLAMAVEDHPYDYKDFEGEIPPGNYGAGYVYVWDKGTYELLHENGRSFDASALKEWKDGNLKVVLHGKKLKGEFALVKMKGGREENAWLMIKHRDKYAVDEAYDSEEHTPKRVIEKLKGPSNNKAAETKGRRTPAKKATPKKKAATAKKASPRAKKSAAGAAKKPAAKKDSEHTSRMKTFYAPMLTTLVDAPFDREGWIFEPKWDGYRAIAAVKDGETELYSRNKLSFNEAYAPIVEAVENIPHNVVLDGEIIILGANKKSDFQALQNYRSTGKGKLVYQVFDLLHLDGHELGELPLTERKILLEELVKQLDDPRVQYSAHVAGKGVQLFEKAAKAGWEGIIAKDGESGYAGGVRTMSWLKIKVTGRQEAVICGYTAPRGARKNIGALLLGVYEGKKLRYIGLCGGGFNDVGLKSLYEKLQDYRQDDSPFEEKIKTNMPVTWLKPELVCEVKFSEWTQGGLLRQPIFIALREDKPATAVKREVAQHITGAGKKTAAAKKEPMHKPKANMQEPAEVAKDRVLTLNKQEVQLTNQQKIYWPKEKITKGQLIDYYLSVADYILPHLKDRALSLHRFPNGIAGQSFYQKDLDLEQVPAWLKTTQVHSESTNKVIDYLVCNNEATLAYMVNLGCIEINPWLSRIRKPENPDYVVLDLDPEDIAFTAVVETAQTIRKILESHDIVSYCKTSGASGLHIYVPTGGKYPYETCRLFAEYIAQTANEQLPEITSIIRAKAKRKNKVYIDFLQNAWGQTIASPYSARPQPGATVATPLQWKEVNAKLDIKDFHIGNTLKRLEKQGDLWENILKEKNDLKTILKSVAQ